MLYSAETTDFVVYSSRAALAGVVWLRLPDEDPQERDPVGVGWMMFFSYFVDERTGFVGTPVLPSGTSVDVHPNWGSRVMSASTTPWAEDFTPGSVRRRRWSRLVHDDLVRSVQSFGLLRSSRRYADLTGGTDSRLILALLVRCGNHGQVQVPDDRSAHTPPMPSSAMRCATESSLTTTRSIPARWILRCSVVVSARTSSRHPAC